MFYKAACACNIKNYTKQGLVKEKWLGWQLVLVGLVLLNMH